MNPDLERLVALQKLDSGADDAGRRLAEEPDRLKALDTRLDAARAAVASAKERLAANHAARRSIEKDVSMHQTRLSKFRDQLMAVKTNVEYQAMQKEIGYAQTEVKGLEDQILELMLEGDELSAAVKSTDAALAAEQKAVDADRRALASEVEGLKQSMTRLAKERAELVRSLDPQALLIFETVARRRHGVAVAEARDGICMICHVRLRPQIFNDVRRNDQIIQCDSCNRILYFVPVAAPAANGMTQSAS
jgi:hypothetical protein